MQWSSGLPFLHSRRRCVLGLDVGPEACTVVVLSGSQSQPDAVACAERLALPKGVVANGEVLQSLALGQWLRTYLQVGGHQPHMAYIGVDSVHVSSHSVTLVAGLLPDDVAFQLQAEVQSLLRDDRTEVCIDYRIDAEHVSVSEQHYWVQAVPRPWVEALQRAVRLAGVKAAVVEPRHDAACRTERREVWATLSQAHAAMALPCEQAFGLALRAWHEGGVNFLPHRQDAQRVLCRRWLLSVVAWAMGGAFLAAVLAMVMVSEADNRQPHARDVAASARAFADAQQAHQQAQALQERRTEQARWLQVRHVLQSHSSQWSRVLDQAAQGVWVTQVKQQGIRWTVQGEALSSTHVQQLVRQLKALDIWAQAPELPQLQVMPAAATTGLPVWHFRIEANLKAGV